jgi:CubicO group peptidase (beta-lactamase class C family)
MKKGRSPSQNGERRLSGVARLFAAALLLPLPSVVSADSTGTAGELVGLWKAQHDFAPDAGGALVLEKSASGWSAHFKGRRIAVREDDRVLTFDLANGGGGFRARLQPDGDLDNGQWFQPRSPTNPSFGTGITFESQGPNRWRGDVLPIEDTSTFYLMLQERPDGSVGAFLRNREFNLGKRYNLDRLVRDGEAVQLIGRFRGETADRVLLSGTFDPEAGVLSLAFDPPLDGSYDFRRADDESDFYPRGRSPGRYVYQPPPARDDGWPVATLDEVNIDRKGIESFVQRILDMPMDSVETMQIDAILIARQGKLVLEEYFHGFDRDTMHSSRSASKSLTATLIGAAMQAGLPVSLSSPVYQVMNGGSFPDGLEARKRAMTLEHLLTMTSGLFCDDGNPDAPGNEETMTSQADEPDFYRFYMRVPMDREPGAEAVYCSGDPNLAIGVLQRATGEHPMDLFDRLLGEPLQIARHGWYLSPSRQAYGGGSVNMIPRDFSKLGQLMLNKGNWKGRRILSEDFVRRASAPAYDLNGIKYGYLWWGIDWPYKNRTVHGFFAGGNGGQGIIVVPELDLVIATQGSNYASRLGLEIQQGLTPRFILPAVREAGDAMDAPVVPREYTVIYGRRPRVAPPGPSQGTN